MAADSAPTGVDAVAARLAPFVADPDRSAVIVDFDGTLAPIVVDPPLAAPLPATPSVLARLVRRIGTVAVVSGRPVEFLRNVLPVDGLVLCGHYGVERFDGTAISALPEAGRWVDAVRAAADEAEAALPDLYVERKGALAVALHWRRRPDLEAEATELGRRLAAQRGLHMEPGRLALELRPPVDVDKGTATTDLAAGAAAVLVMGDDRGDIAAFAALDRLAGGGDIEYGLRVAVRSAESPPELLALADLHVDGPARALAILSGLADLLDRDSTPPPSR